VYKNHNGLGLAIRYKTGIGAAGAAVGRGKNKTFLLNFGHKTGMESGK
jgi:hypothetical protein